MAWNRVNSALGRLDVISVCASHLGTKQHYKPTDPVPYRLGTELIEIIRKREINAYKLNPNRLREDYSGEKETKLDYGGRAIWELLQNADDAMAPKAADLIGVNGRRTRNLFGGIQFLFFGNKNSEIN